MTVEKWEMPFKTAYERAKEYEEVIQIVCMIIRNGPESNGMERGYRYLEVRRIFEVKGWL